MSKTKKESIPNKKNISRMLLYFSKYCFSAVLIIIATIASNQFRYLFVGILELLCVFFFTEVICIRFKKIRYVLNSLGLFVMNVQMAVLFWGGSYVSVIMMTNLDNIDGLVGKAFQYILTAVLVLVFSFLPVKKVIKNKMLTVILVVLFAAGELAAMFGLHQKEYSVYYKAVYLVKQLRDNHAATEAFNEVARNTLTVNSENAETADIGDRGVFYSDIIEDGIEKPDNIAEQPNIIVIFTEGLSQNVVDDERNIMPNVKEYQEKSLDFVNYYNHTAATYRGLVGQLYSGYQRDNYDHNRLISLQSILKHEGYNSCFINVESGKGDFTNYLESFGFDEVRAAPEKMASDKIAYEDLFNTALEYDKKDEPFLLSIYTYGTHVSFDSPDEKFGDGSNGMLNKFYNCDYQFGEFMKRFEDSELADDTIIVFTTDHATYLENEFSNTFPYQERPVYFLDEIPFFIYYVGVEPEKVDANGRNSLCMVPTLLDYLDISEPNYFLGKSLYTEYLWPFEWTFYIPGAEEMYSSNDDEIISLSEELRTFESDNVRAYFYYAIAVDE